MSDPLEETGSEVVKSLLAPVADFAADAFGVIVGDRLANYRLSNVIKTYHRLQALADEHGLKLRYDKIPDRFAFSWFEEVGKHDEDNIQDLFARLMAQVASGTSDPNERLVRALGSLTANEASVFSKFIEWKPAQSSIDYLPSFRRQPGNRLYDFLMLSPEAERSGIVLALDGLAQARLIIIDSRADKAPMNSYRWNGFDE